MSYIVPGQLPEFCNKCPFGTPHYNSPFWSVEPISLIDGKMNKANTWGYICNIDFIKNGEYTKVMRGKTNLDIKKPDWCQLLEVKEGNE